GTDFAALNDVWALSFAAPAAWSPVAVAGEAPAGRSFAAATFDPVRQRMLVFGGVDRNHQYLDDVWGLSLAGAPLWSLVAAPPFSWRTQFSSIYDPPRDRVLVFGGTDRAQGLETSETWSLPLSGSSQPALLAIDAPP